MQPSANDEWGGTSAYERSVIGFRSDPRMRRFVQKNYLEENLEEAVSRYVRSDEFSRVSSILDPFSCPNSRLADLGAGRGLTSLALAQRGIPVISVEYDPSDVVGLGAFSKAEGLDQLPLRLVRGDALQLPLGSGCFDVVFCRSVLHHLTNLDRGLKEIGRILKPGGLLLACNEHILSPFSKGRRFLAAHPAVPYGVDERAYPVWAYWWKLRKTGFHRIRFFGYDGYALELAEFLQATKQNSVRAHLVALPLGGRFLGRILHALHVLARRPLRYLFVPEQYLPAISIVAQKFLCESPPNRHIHVAGPQKPNAKDSYAIPISSSFGA